MKVCSNKNPDFSIFQSSHWESLKKHAGGREDGVKSMFEQISSLFLEYHFNFLRF